MDRLLAEIEADLAEVSAWSQVDFPGGIGGHRGRGRRWVFLVAEVGGVVMGTVAKIPRTIGPGVPEVRSVPDVVSLPQEIARRAHKLATGKAL